VVQADVSRANDLTRILDQIDHSMPPLRGLVHAAGVLDDGLLLHQEWSRFVTVMAPKIDGAWNLHALTLDRPLDFFVLFSSMASLLGSPSQGNYAAANAFLDALAHHRRAQGRPALSINWGAWADVGMASRLSRQEQRRFTEQGLGLIESEQGKKILDDLLLPAGVGPAQVGVLPINWPLFRTSFPTIAGRPFLAEQIDRHETVAPKGKTVLLRDVVLCAPAEERPQLLESLLSERMAGVLGIAVATLDRELPVTRMGFDSLMALELKNRLDADLGVVIPMVQFLEGPSVADLTTLVLAELTAAPAPPLAHAHRAPQGERPLSTKSEEDWEEGEL
jgi:acyl carrier protein